MFFFRLLVIGVREYTHLMARCAHHVPVTGHGHKPSCHGKGQDVVRKEAGLCGSGLKVCGHDVGSTRCCSGDGDDYCGDSHSCYGGCSPRCAARELHVPGLVCAPGGLQGTALHLHHVHRAARRWRGVLGEESAPSGLHLCHPKVRGPTGKGSDCLRAARRGVGVAGGRGRRG